MRLPPPLPAPRSSRMPPVEQHTLASGLDVFVVRQHVVPVVDVRFVVRAGAAHSDPHLAGCAYLTADLLDEGTHSRSAPEVADEAELLGASLATRASWDYSAVTLHVLSPRVEQALELLADVMTRPAFSPDELERKRAERLASILHERADPHTLATLAFYDVLYGRQHPYGHAIGGGADTITRITADDVRSFYNRHFVPGNGFVAVAGDVDSAALLDMLERFTHGWPAGDGQPAAALPEPQPHEPAVHIVDRPGAPQSELRIGHAGPPRSTADYFALHVANTVLGGAFTSRLNMLLREEKAYTYGAGSSFAFRAGGGPFVASTAVATSATADAVASTVREIERLRDEPVPEAELERARRYIVLGLPRTFETTGDIAEHISDIALNGLGWDYYDRYAAAIEAVTAGDVQAAARRWLRPEQLAIVIAGDASAMADELATTGLGAVHVRNEE